MDSSHANDDADAVTDKRLIANWYRFAADRPDSLDALLSLLRQRKGQTLEQQQDEFGVTDEQYMRLRALRPPRPDLFLADAQRIAEACALTHPLAFVQALVLARN